MFAVFIFTSFFQCFDAIGCPTGRSSASLASKNFRFSSPWDGG